MKVVIDTNSISPRSESYWLWQALLAADFDLFVTTDILDEYAEIIGRKMGQEVAEAALDLLTDLPNVHLIQKYFLWQLVEADPDDNKFVDGAIAAGAQYLVSEDKHLRIVRKFPYLNIELVSLSEFQERLSAYRST